MRFAGLRGSPALPAVAGLCNSVQLEIWGGNDSRKTGPRQVARHGEAGNLREPT